LNRTRHGARRPNAIIIAADQQHFAGKILHPDGGREDLEQLFERVRVHAAIRRNANGASASS